ncbi:hypothetical protein EIP86_004347 [Pleurotus ostreatoroseus]|nr:hypothetical protein EIP86_004347 [Pleurotus ostreatoroseus]
MHCELPVEIWLKICRLACTDDGATARTLSAVSRQIRAATAEHHYRVVAVYGTRQALKLFRVQQRLPRARRIRHLYVYDPRNYASGLAVAAMPRTADEVAAMHGVLEHACATVETLTVVSCTTRHTFAADHLQLDDLHFPHLAELTLRGCYSLPLRLKFAPNLVRLHIACDVLHSPFARLLPKFYPRLTHLRISRLEWSPHFNDVLETLCSTMGLRDRNGHMKDATDAAIHTDTPTGSSARFILIEPGPGHWIGPEGRTILASTTERALLYRTLNDKTDRITVLPQCPGHSKTSEAAHARADWLDRINGGLGCWVSLNSEKAVCR